MSALSIQPTYPIFTDIDGQPLEDGFVWIGQANLDPQVNPINVFWDAALTIPAGQPIRTLAGYPSNSGTPARLYVNSDYSIRVMNKNGSVVYSAPAATERYNGGVISTINASQVVYDPAGTGAVPSTAQNQFRERISATNYGFSESSSALDNQLFLEAAITQAAILGKDIFIPAGDYDLNSGTDVLPNVSIYGEQGTILRLAEQASNVFLPKGNNRFENLQIIGTRTNEDPGGSRAVWRLTSVSNIWIKNVQTDQILGDVVYFADSSNVWIESCKFLRSSRWCFVINDDATGTSNVWIDNCYVTAYGLGIFDGESDESLYVVQNIHITNFHGIALREGGGYGSSGIFFTKSTTTGASGFRKYRNIHLNNVKIENTTSAVMFRGADRVFIDNLDVVSSLADAVDIGNGNTVSAFFMSNFRINCEGTAIQIRFGHATEQTNRIVISDGVVNGQSTTGSYGVFSLGERVRINNVTFDASSGTTTTAVIFQTLSKDVFCGNCFVRGYTNSGITVSSADTESKIIGNTIDLGAGACNYGIYVGSGSGTLINVSENQIMGTPAVEALFDEGWRALRYDNMNVDRILGRALTTGTANSDFTFSSTGTAFLTCAEERVVGFNADVVARRTGSSIITGARYIVEGVFRNDSGAYALIGVPTVTTVGESLAGLDVTVTIDASNGLVLTAVGNTNDFRWRADIQLNII